MARGRPPGRSKSDHRVCQEARYARAAEYRERIAISAEQQDARIAAVNAERNVEDAPCRRRRRESRELKVKAGAARMSTGGCACKESGSGNKKAKKGLEHLLGKAAGRDLHSLHCRACGATAVFGLRGGKEGGSINYSCKAHGTSSGRFRIDRDRAVWAADQELRRLRAKARRLEQELRDLEGAAEDAPSAPAFAAEQESGGTTDWVSMPKSRSLIATLLLRGGVESNPGPTPQKVALKEGWLELYPNMSSTLLDYLTEQEFALESWRGTPKDERPALLSSLRQDYPGPGKWLNGWTAILMSAAAAGKRGQDAEAGQSSDVDMRDADQGIQKGDLGPSPIKKWSEREEAVGDKIVKAHEALAHCMVTEPDPFRSPVTNEHTEHIGGLNIVAAPPDTPLLLLTNLPSGNQGGVATDDEVLKWFHKADNEPIIPPPTAVLLGPPGIGKTRKCMLLGSTEPGVIYLTCERSGELRAPDMEAVRAKLEPCEAEPQSWKANFVRAKRHLLACLYARSSLLKYFLENQARQAWDLRHWMLFQSGVAFGASMAPMLELYRLASLVHVDQLEEQLAALLGECTKLLGDNRRVCIALDEAQSWSSALNHCFSNGDEPPQGRPLLTAAMRILAEPPLSQHLKILLAGTGFSLLSTNIIDSALAKHGTFKARQLSLFKTLSEDEVRQYAAHFAGKEEADGAVEQIRKLVGRARFVVGAVQRWVGEGGERSLRDVLEEEYDLHTDPGAWNRSTLVRPRYEKLYLYGTLCAQARHPKSANLFQQLKRLTFAHWVIGQPACFRNKEEADLVNLGCALLEGERDTQMAAIREPVVQTAVQNFLKHEMQWDPQTHAEEMFCESGFQPQVLGNWWELVVAQFIRHMFETKEALADKPLFSNLGRDTLPPAFRKMGASLVAVWRDQTSRQFRWKEIEKEERFLKMKVGTPAYRLVDFLKDPQGFVLFFPEDKAGPDLVFFMVVGGKLFLVFVQLKLAIEVKEPLKVLRTVDPSTAYNNHPSERKFREEIKEALGPDSGLAGVIACIIGYPLKLPKSIFEEVRDCRPPRRASKRLKLEVVADYDISPAVRVVVDGSQKSDELARTDLKPLIDALKKAGAVETSTSPTEGTSSSTPMDVS